MVCGRPPERRRPINFSAIAFSGTGLSPSDLAYPDAQTILLLPRCTNDLAAQRELEASHESVKSSS